MCARPHWQASKLEQEKARRPRCGRCLRPASHCLCAYIPNLHNHTHVLVLQHLDEARHPLNTARLAVLGLAKAELLVGETFPQLADKLAVAEQALLLFPAENESSVLQAPTVAAKASTILVVPDGTWRKARRLIRSNPILNTLPRLSLPPGEPSAYRVRKASEPAAVASIEAIVRALHILEPQQDFQPLLKPFNKMVAQQIQAMGEDTYRRNHTEERHELARTSAIHDDTDDP